MSYIKNLFLFGLLCLLSASLVQCKGTCDSLLLSISSADICEDGLCRAKELAQVRTDLGKDHSFCFRVDQHLFNTVDKVVNFTIIDAWVSYTVRDCYVSDDPQTDIQGYCACSLSSPVDCTHCSALELLANDTLCVDGSNRGTGCFGLRSATHCVKAGFDGGQRYKVCSVGKPKIELLYQMYDTEKYVNGFLDLSEETTISTSQANITFYDISEPPKLNNRMLVVDLLNKANIYAIPNEFINTALTTDPEKLGWYRWNTTVNPNMKKFINVDVLDCSEDSFRFGYSAAQFRNQLAAHPDWQMQNSIPDAIWIDADTLEVQTYSPTYDPPLPTLVQGGFFLTTSGEIVPFGLSTDGTSANMGDVQYTGPILTNYGLIDTTTSTEVLYCTQWYPVGSDIDYTSDSAGIKRMFQLRQCSGIAQEQNVLATWGVCYQMITDDINPDDDYNDLITSNCTSISFAGTMWPDNRYGAWGVTWYSQTLGFWIGADFVNQFNQTSESLKTRSTNLFAKADVEFLNITIAFDVTNVIPRITAIDHDENEITVWAESTSVKGNCLLMTSDNFTPTKTIELTLTPNKYKTPIIANKFKGDVELIIQCYKNKDKVLFEIEIDRGQANLNYNSIEPNNVRKVSKEETNWETAKRGAGKIWGWITDKASVLWNLTDNVIANFFIGLILTIATFLGSALGMYVIYYIIRWSFPRIWRRLTMWYRRRNSKSSILPSQRLLAASKAQ
jgi:hypothetical protein